MTATVLRFIRSVPTQSLKECFSAYAPHIAANTNWQQDASALRKALIKSVEAATDAELGTILSNIGRIDEMCDDIGQAALLCQSSHGACVHHDYGHAKQSARFRGSTVEARGFKTARNAGKQTFASRAADSQLKH